MRRALLIAAVAACLVMPSGAAADTIRVQSTTDTVDAGLVEGMLRAAYKAAQPGDTLDYTAVGTGKALDNARAGLGDVVITHAPSLEAKFVADGLSVGLGRQIFYSDYVIVGPADDPAHIVANGHAHDAIGAFEDIANAGAANPNAVRFKSRGDNSGTNVQEQIMWHLSNVSPKQAATGASNPTNESGRDEPGTGGAPPAWYIKATGTQGQAKNLNETEACVVAGNGCYTMLDRGTFNAGVNAGTITHLKILTDKNTPDARGGENLLVNPFSVYIVNPAKITTSPAPNVAAATRFADFLVSAGFQKALESFPNAIDPAFLPDAFPKLTLDAPLPQTAALKTSITIAGTAANRLPGAGAIAGLGVFLQRSTDNGATWTNVGQAVSGAGGRFAIPYAIGASGMYRLATGASPASNYNQFSPSTQDIGAITVPATPAKPDKTKPTATKVKLGKRSLSLRVSEASSVKVVIQKRVMKGKKTRYSNVQTVRGKASKARTLTIRHKALKKAHYRLRITTTDLAGNHRTQTRSFNVR